MEDEKRLTPMLAQYKQIKARFPDALVLFRLGDFYELFDEDAKIGARELELALTGRSFAKGVRLPMAGVPHHHVQAYIAKLIDKGYKVALVEQLEDPKKVNRLAKRDVVRIITPGTVVEDSLLRPKSENYLAAIVRGLSVGAKEYGSVGAKGYGSNDFHTSTLPHSIGLALLDISTGEFATTQIDGADAESKLFDELQRAQASEFVLPQPLANDETFVAQLRAIRPVRLSPVDERVATYEVARRELLAHFRIPTLDVCGCEHLPLATAAAGVVLQYLKHNQPNLTPGPSPKQERGGEETSPLQHLNHLWTFSLADYMALDAATRRNLELTTPISADVIGIGRRHGHATHAALSRSLFGVLDYTLTAMGARLLRRWLQQPLLDLAQIHARQAAVEELQRNAFLRSDLRQLLDGLYDVERLVGRIGFGNANARDLMALRRTLARLPSIKKKLMGDAPQPAPIPPSPKKHATASKLSAHQGMSLYAVRDVPIGATDAAGVELPPHQEANIAVQSAYLRELGANLDELQDVMSEIERALVSDPPMLIREGGLIKNGYDASLDALRERAIADKKWLSELEAVERERTGIKNLRVKYNEIFGFFIEAPRSQGHLIPKEYERRASITHAERFVTPALKAKEADILSTEDRMNDLEYELFTALRGNVAMQSARLQAAARILAQLDALCSLAEAAARYGYVKPVVDDGDVIEVHEGRHPVVERFLRDGESFVPNDVRLDNETQRVIILTGPNMSGKSVFIRQVALIVLLAQVGSFVPASHAHIGLADRIFTRVGASDDIAQGRSTFLVEMSEASYILRHATPRSLIVLDEVGRGTSTYDGISLAWAIAEEIHNHIGAKTLFATHYHELTQLAQVGQVFNLPNAIHNYTMAVKERGNEVIFLRQVIAGGAEKSFGIHVAQLAGLHPRIISRANEVLRRLEAERDDDAAKREMGGNEGDKGDEARATSDYAMVKEEQALYEARREVWREVLRELAQVDVANLTPVQALVLLNEVQGRLKSGS
jgi:DNA mismatch repair protein MutS